jgi:predicted nucleic acid-binding protein
VSYVVLLDAEPLGLVTNPRRSSASLQCAHWLQILASNGVRVIVPEIADYEIRRELLRANKTNGLNRLDALIHLSEYLPITTATMRQAAQFWAQARQQGQPTAADAALDGDAILAVQAMTLNLTDVVIATTNVGHLSRFVPAELWQNIRVG